MMAKLIRKFCRILYRRSIKQARKAETIYAFMPTRRTEAERAAGEAC